MIIFEGKQLIKMQGFGGKYHEKAFAQAGFGCGNKGDQKYSFIDFVFHDLSPNYDISFVFSGLRMLCLVVSFEVNTTQRYLLQNAWTLGCPKIPNLHFLTLSKSL